MLIEWKMTIYYLSIKKIHKFSLKCPKILYINLTGWTVVYGLELDEDLIAFLFMWIICLPLHWFIISHHLYTNVIYVDLFPCTLFCPIVFLFMHWYHTLLITTDLKWVSISLSGSQGKLLFFFLLFSCFLLLLLLDLSFILSLYLSFLLFYFKN